MSIFLWQREDITMRHSIFCVLTCYKQEELLGRELHREIVLGEFCWVLESWDSKLEESELVFSYGIFIGRSNVTEDNNLFVCDSGLWSHELCVSKSPINPVTNPSPVYSHYQPCDNTCIQTWWDVAFKTLMMKRCISWTCISVKGTKANEVKVTNTMYNFHSLLGYLQTMHLHFQSKSIVTTPFNVSHPGRVWKCH
jgi:hypothetical protein